MPEIISLNLPIITGVLAVALLLLGVLALVRRRRNRQQEAPPLPAAPIDYTSLPVDQPTNWRERLARLPLAGKLLLGLIPIAIIAAIFVVVQSIPAATPPGIALVPTEAPRTIENLRASVSNERTITVRATTNLPDDTQIAVEIMGDNGEPLRWSLPEEAIGTVRSGEISLRIPRAEDAAAAQENVIYTVTLAATVAGQVISAATELRVPNLYADAFYGRQAVVLQASAAPTAELPALPATAAATAEATVEPTLTAEPLLTALVFNGGRVRAAPLDGAVLDMVNANETVILLEQTSDGQWLRIINQRDITGWVSVTLLTIDAAVLEQVPLQGSTTVPPSPVAQITPSADLGLRASVFNGGRVRARPVDGEVLDMINAGETVVLLQKDAAGAWYLITTERNITGWTSVTLLTIDRAVADQVPVAP